MPLRRWRLLLVGISFLAVSVVPVAAAVEVDPSPSSSSSASSDPQGLRLGRRRAQQPLPDGGAGFASNETTPPPTTPTTTTEPPALPVHLIRVWVSYQPFVTHDDGLAAIQSSLVQGLNLPDGANETIAANFDTLAAPDQDQPGFDPLTRQRRFLRTDMKGRHLQGGSTEEVVADNFRVHYDFFDSGMNSIAMSVTPDVLQALKADPTVRKIKRDPKRFPLTAVPASERESFNPRLGGRRKLDEIPYGIDMVNAPAAWNLGYRGQKVTVCVMDSGLDMKHPEYSKLKWTGASSPAGGWNADGFGHGTHVTGTLAARSNGVGVVGVAPRARVVVVKVFDSKGKWAYASSVGNAALQCQKLGAKVINMSLGGTGASQGENDIFASLLKQGVVSVAAAANYGSSTYFYPASYQSVVSVAAVDSARKVAGFSQKNDRVDVAAPGVAVYSTLPAKKSAFGSKYGTLSGTSMATPHVAGLAALLFSKNLTLSGPAVISAITSSATDLGKKGYDTSYGFGLVSATAALAKV